MRLVLIPFTPLGAREEVMHTGTSKWHRFSGVCVGPQSAVVQVLERRMLLSAAFQLQALGFLDTPVPGPGGETHVNDFEPGSINNRGQVAYGTDLSTGGEGVFIK